MLVVCAQQEPVRSFQVVAAAAFGVVYSAQYGYSVDKMARGDKDE